MTALTLLLLHSTPSRFRGNENNLEMYKYVCGPISLFVYLVVEVQVARQNDIPRPDLFLRTILFQLGQFSHHVFLVRYH